MSWFHDARVAPGRSKTFMLEATIAARLRLCNPSRRLAPQTCISSFHDAHVSPGGSKVLVPTSAITTTKVHLCNLSRRLAPRTCLTFVSRRGAPRHIADLGTAGSVEVLSLPPNSTRPTDNSFLGLTASSGESCQAHGTERRTSFKQDLMG